MAATGIANSSGKGTILLALLVLGMMAQSSEASTFVFWASGCSGTQATLNACGCSTIPSNTKGGYRFTYTGQTAAAYNSAGCTGVAHTRFNANTGQCSALGWQSVFIQC